MIAAEPITDVDTTAGTCWSTLDQELEAVGVRLVFAELKGHVRDHLRDYGVLEKFAADRFFPTLGTAVRGYLAASGVEWTDWEDEPSSRTAT